MPNCGFRLKERPFAARAAQGRCARATADMVQPYLPDDAKPSYHVARLNYLRV
jgi:hypothetical protein